MTDRFRFRVWNRETGYLDDCDFSINQMGELIGVQLFNSPYIVEQCTGLKDKNGKLIYENDILQLERKDICGYNVHHYVVNTKIERQKNGQYVAISNDYRYYCWETNLELVTVIGNIHENPELLEVKNGK